MRLARNLIIFVHVMSLAAFAFAIPRHLGDSAWPDHAKNHALQALFWVVGFHIVSIVIALGPLSRREAWAWWALLASGAFIFGGYFISIPITGGGAPGPLDDYFFGALSLIYIGGLTLLRPKGG